MTIFVVTYGANSQGRCFQFDDEQTADLWMDDLPSDQSGHLIHDEVDLREVPRGVMRHLYRIAGHEVGDKWPSSRGKGAQALMPVLSTIAATPRPKAEKPEEPKPEEPKAAPQPAPADAPVHVHTRQIIGHILAFGVMPAKVFGPTLKKLDELARMPGPGAEAELKGAKSEHAASTSALYRAAEYMKDRGFQPTDPTGDSVARVRMYRESDGATGFINKHGEIWIGRSKVGRAANGTRKHWIDTPVE